MKQVKVSLEEEDLDALEDISKDQGQKISALIRKAVKFWLKEAKKA
jgi:metal-responsive CopG/Arc/MetJ family transcriptional regulator